jgi:hypothetical protein
MSADPIETPRPDLGGLLEIEPHLTALQGITEALASLIEDTGSQVAAAKRMGLDAVSLASIPSEGLGWTLGALEAETQGLRDTWRAEVAKRQRAA